MHLANADVSFVSSSIVDPNGRVFFHGGRVFRAVYDSRAGEDFRRALDSRWIRDAFEAGLVKTWIPQNVALEGAALVLEHERVPFTVVPAELTARGLWDATRMLVRLGAVLAREGVSFKDAHPLNILLHRGRPVFVDLGSLVFGGAPGASWLDEFRRYFAVPLWLSSRGMDRLAQEYRRQHLTGFGLRVFDHPMLRWPMRAALGGLRPAASPQRLFERLTAWVDSHEPRTNKERWASYHQAGTAAGTVTSSAAEKQRFVSDVLSAMRPASVLDCAANKGFYSEMAAGLGASVVAFDYEEYCVDECRALADGKGLDITPALVDFRLPTPPSGLALAVPDAYERYRSDCVLALGLCHHICIAQRVPVQVFSEICLRYATRAVVLEYVDPSDVHVAAWKLPTPVDYSIDGFTRHFSRLLPNRTVKWLDGAGGVKRAMLLFER